MTFEQKFEIQARLLYSMIVAGKSADFADKATKTFLQRASTIADLDFGKDVPFDVLERLSETGIEQALREAKTGNYGKLKTGIVELSNALKASKLDLFACTPMDLEQFHGIGPKTSRFFIMWCERDGLRTAGEPYAALDVHVLRWMKNLGYDVPRATPQSLKRYRAIEVQFIAEAKRLGKTPNQLDEEIWIAGAGRTQTTATP